MQGSEGATLEIFSFDCREPIRGGTACGFAQRRAGKACFAERSSVPAILCARHLAGTRCALCPPYGIAQANTAPPIRHGAGTPVSRFFLTLERGMERREAPGVCETPYGRPLRSGHPARRGPAGF